MLVPICSMGLFSLCFVPLNYIPLKYSLPFILVTQAISVAFYNSIFFKNRNLLPSHSTLKFYMS